MADEEESVVEKVIQNLRSYLQNNLSIDEEFIEGLQGQTSDLLHKRDADRIRSSLSKGSTQALGSLLDHMAAYYVGETLETFCTFLDDYSKHAKRPRLGKIATKIRAEIKKHRQTDTQQQDGDVVPTVTVRATQGETTSNTSTTEERSQDKIKEIVEMYRSGDYDVRVPEIPELERDFLDVMVKLDHKLACADPQVIRTIRSNVRMEYRTYIYGWKPVELPAVPETPGGLYDFIAAKSTPYEVPLVNCAVQVLKEATLMKTFEAYKSKLADLWRVKLHSCKMRNVTLPKRKDCTHLAAVVSRDKDLVLISLALHIKEYLMKYLQLEETIFEGFGEGCTVLFFSIFRIDAVLLALKILSHSAELKRMFDITHLVVFDYFACDLERATIELPATSQRTEPVLQIKDLKEEMLRQFEQLQTSKVIEDVMKHEHLQNKATALEMKLKEEEMLRKKAEEEQRRITRELVKMEKKLSESGSKSSIILKKAISNVEGLLGQSSESVEGLQDKIRIPVEEWSKISEHEDLSQSTKFLRINDLEEEMLRQFEHLKTFEKKAFKMSELEDENWKLQKQIGQLEEANKFNQELKAENEELLAKVEDLKRELHLKESLQHDSPVAKARQLQREWEQEKRDLIAKLNIWIRAYFLVQCYPFFIHDFHLRGLHQLAPNVQQFTSSEVTLAPVEVLHYRSIEGVFKTQRISLAKLFEAVVQAMTAGHSLSLSATFFHFAGRVTLYRFHIVVDPKVLVHDDLIHRCSDEGGAIPRAFFTYASVQLKDGVTPPNIKASSRGAYYLTRMRGQVDLLTKSLGLHEQEEEGAIKLVTDHLDGRIARHLDNSYASFAKPKAVMFVPECSIDEP